MKLRIEICDNQTGLTESLVICESDSKFIEIEKLNDIETLMILVDEGCVNTWYYYPLDRYQIVYIARFDG